MIFETIAMVMQETQKRNFFAFPAQQKTQFTETERTRVVQDTFLRHNKLFVGDLWLDLLIHKPQANAKPRRQDSGLFSWYKME